MTAPSSTFSMYARLAIERPAKARRYRASITDTLERTTIHPIERERLEQALAGIASVLGEVHTCSACGRTLTDPESISAGIGPDCAERLAAAFAASANTDNPDPFPASRMARAS